MIDGVLPPEERERLFTLLGERNPEACLLEPREHFDLARMDITDDPQDHWNRGSRDWVAVYDEIGCIAAIKRWFGPREGGQDPDEGAREWFSANTSDAWVGPSTWTFGCKVCKAKGICDYHDEGCYTREDAG